MEEHDLKRLEKYAPTDPELKALWEEHMLYEKQIEKLDPDNVTTKTAKTVQKAWDAYWKLTDAQRTFVDSLLYEKLEQCYNNLP